MKKTYSAAIVIGLLFTMPRYCNGQQLTDSLKIDPESKNLLYSEVIELPGTKSELFNKAKMWFAESFINSNYVLKTEDKEQGLLIGKGSFIYKYQEFDSLKRKEISLPTTDKCEFIIKIFVKDNKYKYVITDLIDGASVLNNQRIARLQELEACKYCTTYKTVYSSMSVINSRIVGLISSIKTRMASKSESDF